MSIYISGMKMPKEGSHNVFILFGNGDVTDYDGKAIGKAISVPAHGRGIDANALTAHIVGTDNGMFVDGLLQAIDAAPTIIPADSEKGV